MSVLYSYDLMRYFICWQTFQMTFSLTISFNLKIFIHNKLIEHYLTLEMKSGNQCLLKRNRLLFSFCSLENMFFSDSGVVEYGGWSCLTPRHEELYLSCPRLSGRKCENTAKLPFIVFSSFRPLALSCFCIVICPALHQAKTRHGTYQPQWEKE